MGFAKIKIETRASSISGGKKVTTSWQEYYSPWCEVLDLIRDEKYEAYNSKLENSLKFKCRLCEKLKLIDKDIRLKSNGQEYRIIFNDTTYNIIFIDTLGNSKSHIIFQGMAIA